MEEWKEVVDFEGLYLVSNLGNIKRHPNASLLSKTHNKDTNSRKLYKNHCGYYYLDLCKNGKKIRKTVHQIVAAAFIPGFHYGDTVNHIDGDKANNAVSNLEKTTNSANEIHKYAHGLGKKAGKSKYHNVGIGYQTYKDKRYKFYLASVKINNKRHYIGQFKDEVDAAKAVDAFWDSIGDTQHLRNFPAS